MGIHGLMPEHADAPEHKFQGRVPIIVADDESRDAWLHFVALAPEGMDFKTAMTTITAEFVKVRKANPDEWNYGELDDALTALGFVTFLPTVWEEQSDGYPPGTQTDDGEDDDDDFDPNGD